MISSPFPSLRPLTMGELIDRAAVFWRGHLAQLFRIHFGFTIVVFIVLRTFTAIIQRGYPLFRGGAAMQHAVEADPTGAMRQLLFGGLDFGILLLVTNWIGWLASVATSYYTVSVCLGEDASIAGCLRRTFRRMPAVSLALTVACAQGLVIGVVGMLPGAALLALSALWETSKLITTALIICGSALAGLGVLVAALWWLLRFCLTPVVIGVERLSPWQSLVRAGQLVSGRVGPRILDRVKLRAAIMLTVAMAIVMTVLTVSGIPALLVQAHYGHIFDPAHSNSDAIPQALLIPAQLLQVAAQGIFTPFYVVFISLFYLDLRVRKEGLDIEMQLSRPAA